MCLRLLCSLTLNETMQADDNKYAILYLVVVVSSQKKKYTPEQREPCYTYICQSCLFAVPAHPGWNELSLASGRLKPCTSFNETESSSYFYVVAPD